MTPNPYIDSEGHSLAGRLALYRAGKVGPLEYAEDRVPIVACRHCSQSRPDDGTACNYCGVYQRRHDNPAVGNYPPTPPASLGTLVAGYGRSRNQPGKAINPRRKKKHVAY